MWYILYIRVGKDFHGVIKPLARPSIDRPRPFRGLERSIKIGDRVELPDGTAGFVGSVSGRHLLLEPFDGREILAPNEDKITGRVINWTLTSTRGRADIDIAVACGTDLHRARERMLTAARAHPSTLEAPAPLCVLDRFGDSAIEFRLFFCIGDVSAGRLEPKSEVMFAIVGAFKAEGSPFPSRSATCT